MSNTDLIIEERARDIGDFLVGRLLPFRKKRMVGPFIYIDHMGPVTLQGKYADIDQHPHIGLSTLTFLLEGEMVHEDSIGSHQKIAPGAVNWMTAGRGVSHTERTPSELRTGAPLTMHGYQIWVALPKEKEDMEPQFHHIEAHELPSWKDGDLDFRLVAGKAYGRTSPVPVHSDLFMVEIKSEAGALLETGDNLFGEIGICIVSGSIQACEHHVEEGNMLVAKAQDSCNLTLNPNTHILIFGGTPFPEERFIDWNFVSSDRAKIEAAKAAWKEKSFPMMADDQSYIPYPDFRR